MAKTLGPDGFLAWTQSLKKTDVEVSIERLDDSLGTDLVWSSEPTATVIKDSTTAIPLTMWSGTVTIPRALNPGVAFRLVVKEYEMIVRGAGGIWILL